MYASVWTHVPCVTCYLLPTPALLLPRQVLIGDSLIPCRHTLAKFTQSRHKRVIPILTRWWAIRRVPYIARNTSASNKVPKIPPIVAFFLRRQRSPRAPKKVGRPSPLGPNQTSGASLTPEMVSPMDAGSNISNPSGYLGAASFYVLRCWGAAGIHWPIKYVVAYLDSSPVWEPDCSRN